MNCAYVNSSEVYSLLVTQGGWGKSDIFSILMVSLSPGQIETHRDGERIRYFQDDDSVGLHEMVRREKMSSAEDQNSLYARCIRSKQPVLSVKCKCAHLIHQYGNLEHHRVLDHFIFLVLISVLFEVI
jgi:hypothetical protein